MGKHKDRRALKLIETLKSRGKVYNFFVEEEYPLIKGTFYADLVWKLAVDQPPLFSFEVESSPTTYLLKNTMKYFATSSTEIPKPWHHFMIVVKGKIPLGTKKVLLGHIDKHNVHIFENLTNKKEFEHFNKYLEKIVRGFLPTKEGLVPEDFRESFLESIESCTKLLNKGYFSQAHEEIASLSRMLKEKLETWDQDSVKFATKELFVKLFKFTEDEEFCEMYTIFRDLFNYAYSQGNRMIDLMIDAFDRILDESRLYEYDFEKAEKAAEVMLRLAIDFVPKDISISEDCLMAIDYAAEDMAVPELMSKEILLGANILQKIEGYARLLDLVERIAEYLRSNDQESGIRTLLRDSIEYAEVEQEKYGIDIKKFKEEYLLSVLKRNMREDVRGFIDFLTDEIEEQQEMNNTFIAEEIAEIILAYEFLDPNIMHKIQKMLTNSKSPKVKQLFKQAVNNNNFLRKLYEGSDMITTFEELIKFFENNSDMANLSVGVTIYGPSWIDFRKKLNEAEKKAIYEISQKYALQEDSEFELNDQRVTFLVDTLVYLGNDRYDMRKLVDFLKEIDNVAKIENLVTGIEFKLRHISSSSR